LEATIPYRLDLTITQDKSATDSTQVSVPGGVVELFGVGATVIDTVGVPIPLGPGGSGHMATYDVGEIKVGSTVRAPQGGYLSVTSIVPNDPSDPPNSIRIWLQNNGPT